MKSKTYILLLVLLVLNLVSVAQGLLTNSTSWTQNNSTYRSNAVAGYEATTILDALAPCYSSGCRWVSTTATGWVIFNFGSAKTLSQFRIFNDYQANQQPKNCEFQYSNSLSGPWTSVSSYQCLYSNGTNNMQWEYFPAFTAVSAQYWRLVINSSWGSRFQISEVGFIEDCSTLAAPTTATVAPVCEGSSLSLTANAPVGTSYAWTGPNGFTSSVQNPTVSVNTTSLMAGTYSVTVSNNGCTSTAAVTDVTVTPLPSSPDPILGLDTVCQGQQAVTYSISPISNTTAYIWTLPNGTIDTLPTNTINVDFDLSATPGTIMVNGYNGCGNSSVSTLSITVNQLPVIQLSATSNSLCTGQTTTLTATGATTYTWSPGNFNTVQISVSPNSTTDYTVSGSDNGCSSFTVIPITVAVTPTLTISASHTDICSSQSATLTASGASSYTWTPGVITSNSVVVSPTGTTIYTLSGIDNNCLSEEQYTLTVTTTPTLTVNNATLCAGTATILTASGGANYTWMPGNVNTPTLSVMPNTTTIYTVSSTNTECVGYALATVTIIDLPNISITAPTNTLCSSQSTTLTANGADTYTWSPGNPSGTTLTVSPASTTEYTVAGSSNGCSNSTTLLITIIATPTVSIISPTTSICSSQSTTLTANGADTYTWSPGNASGSTLTISPTSTTEYTVLGSNNGCFNSTTITLTVIPSPTLTVSALTNTLCSSQSATLTASGASSYTWSPVAATSSSVVVSPTSTTIYTLSGIDAGCLSEQQYTLTVIPTPTLTVNSATLCAGTSTVLTVSGSTNYTWTPGGVNTQTLSVIPNTTTVYTISSSNLGCIGYAVSTVSVQALPTLTLTAPTATLCSSQTATLTASGASSYIWMPGNLNTSQVVVSPTTTTQYTLTGFEGNCSSSKTTTLTVFSCTGIEELSLSANYKVYPNPASSHLNVELTLPIVSDITITICNAIGQEVIRNNTDNFREGIVSIDVDILTPGIYFLDVITGTQKVTKKLIIE